MRVPIVVAGTLFLPKKLKKEEKMGTAAFQRLEILGLMLRRPVAPLLLKILHQSQKALSKEELREKLEERFRQQGFTLPAEDKIDEDLAWLIEGKLVVVSLMTLTDVGREAALELFGKATAVIE